MSMWIRFGMDASIRQILATARRIPGHHFKRPFLTPYQIAILFEQHYPTEFRDIGLPVGGRGSARRESLAKYIARELSRRIKNGTANDIEGAFLDKRELNSLQYLDRSRVVLSSVQTGYLVSIFRLKASRHYV